MNNNTFITILFALLFVGIINSQTYVPDDNFETYLINEGYDTGPLDDFVPTANITGVVFLDVTTRSIADLTGIEDFTSLEILYCSDNNLTSLDVRNNLNLEYLFCSSNFSPMTINASGLLSLTQIQCIDSNITSLNVNNSTALTTLTCGNNNLTNLDLSSNPSLTGLNCGTNDLTSLDVSNNLALTSLACDLNNIGNLDVSNNIALTSLSCRGSLVSGGNVSQLNVQNGNNSNFTFFDARSNQNLTCIQVDDVSYSNTNWTNKDAQTSYNLSCYDDLTYVPDNGFEQALIDLGYDSLLDDYVTTIVIDNITDLNLEFKGISDLTGIQDFSSLQVLNCGFNSLTSLDVSSIGGLQFLDCSPNNLSSLDVSSNSFLVSLDCRSNSLSSLDVSNNEELTDLFCAFNNLSVLDVSNNTLLSTLRVESNNLSTLNVTNNDQLINLSCWENNLSELDVSNNAFLYDLACRTNNLSSLDVSNNENLGYLICGQNNLTNLDVSNNLLLEYLDVSNNNLSSLSLCVNDNLRIIICHNNPNLSNLNVRNRNNTNIQYFFAIDNPSLTCIQVDDVAYSNANWTNIDAQTNFSVDCDGSQTFMPDDAFETYLINEGYVTGPLDDFVPTSQISCITSLNISFLQNISDLTGIEDFTNLEDLDCEGNILSTLDVSYNTALMTLNCSDNNLSTLDVSSNTALKKLFCNENNLTSLDVSANTQLVDLSFYKNSISTINLSSNDNLDFLGCYNNNLSNLDLSAQTSLTNLQCGYNNLTSLDLSNNPALGLLFCEFNAIEELDLSSNIALFELKCNNNNLTGLNIQNGNNTNIPGFQFNATENPNLLCIQVDNVAYSNTNWTNKDAQSSFSLDCNFAVNCLTVEDGDAFFDITNDIHVILENDDIIKGFQFDITFPNGFIFDPADITKTNLPQNYQVSCSNVGGNSFRVVGFSLQNETIAAGAISILTFPTTINEGTAIGVYPIPITAVTLSDVNNTDVASSCPADGTIALYSNPVGDANGDGTVNILDVVGAIDYILGSPPSAFYFDLVDINSDDTINILDVVNMIDIILSPSSRQYSNKTSNYIARSLAGENYLEVIDANFATDNSETIEINLFNDEVSRGMQFDFVLPEGFTLNPNDIVGTSRLQDFTITSSEISPSTFRVFIVGFSGETIAAGTGVILNVPVFIEPNTTSDTYPISFSNVTISDNSDPAVDVSTTPPRVGEITISTLGVDVTENFEGSIKLYPNPVNDKLSIDSYYEAGYRIYDLNGKIVKKGKMFSGINTVDTAVFQSGLYFIRVKNDKGIIVKKVIKK